MSYAYAQKKRGTAGNAPPSHGGGMDTAGRNIPNSVRLSMLEAGQAAPTAADKGRRVDMPEAMRAKMDSSFGMDFSGVKLYESETLGQTGAEAMARGNEIAFAPGKLDFASREGTALLGHELSHVASQARGEVRGNGFLLDGGLEARADREGAMAARGESVYGGAAAPLSAASAAPMAGPMQASKGKKNQPMDQKMRQKYISEIAGRTGTDDEKARLNGLNDADLQAEYQDYSDKMNIAREAIDAHLYYRNKAEVRHRMRNGKNASLDDYDEERMERLRRAADSKYLGRAYLERKLQYGKGMLADREKMEKEGKYDNDYMDMMAATGESGNRFRELSNVAGMLNLSNELDTEGMETFKKESTAWTDAEDEMLTKASDIDKRFTDSKYGGGSGDEDSQEEARSREHETRKKPLWGRKLGNFNAKKESPELKRFFKKKAEEEKT